MIHFPDALMISTRSPYFSQGFVSKVTTAENANSHSLFNNTTK